MSNQQAGQAGPQSGSVTLLTEVEREDREAQMREVMASHSALRERIQKRHNFDVDSIDWKAAKKDRFFWKKLEESTGELCREANVSSQLGQLMRYGVQQFMFDAYKDVGVVYPDVVQVIQSANRQEWYAPLYGAELPLDIAPGGPYEESRIAGLDTVLINKKVGRILAMQKELWDDDQTGQLAQRAGKLGKRVRYKEEYDVMAAVRGATYSTGIGNRPASYAALSQKGIEDADIALMQIRDPLGNRMGVEPSLLLVSVWDKFAAAKLLNSALQPSVPGAAGETLGSATSGAIGWNGTINPLQGLYSLKVSRFLAQNDWFLMEPKTSIPFQERAPLSVVQEDPNSGESFERDIYRWKVSRRYAVTVLESRYIYAGYINGTAPVI
jgi:hypothetical protein